MWPLAMYERILNKVTREAKIVQGIIRMTIWMQNILPALVRLYRAWLNYFTLLQLGMAEDSAVWVQLV